MSVQTVLRTIAIIGLWLAVFSMTAEARTKMTSQPFGKMPDGTPVEVYTLSDGAFEARIATYGGIVVSLKLPTVTASRPTWCLGSTISTATWPTAMGLQPRSSGPSLGVMPIESRTATLRSMARNIPYLLLNNGENTLHGGPHGFNNVVWKAKPVANGVELSYLSKDGEAGFPGNLAAVVRYTLVKEICELNIRQRRTKTRWSI